jgi:putative membrane protein
MMLRQFELASLGTLTGFVLGSLLVIWPWKTAIYLTDAAGAPILKKGQQVVSGYDWQWPNLGDSNTLLALFLILLAMIVVLVMESVASKATKG